MSRTLTFMLALVVAIVIDHPSTGLAQTAPPMTHIALAALTPPDAATLHYALDQGLFTKAGLDIELQPATSGSASMAALIGGSVQIAYGNILSVAQAHQRGAPVLLLAPGGGYSSRDPVAALLVWSDSSLRSPKDLEGKTIAVTSLHDLMAIAVEGWLDKAGVDFSKIHFLEMPPSAMLAALQAKRVDAMSVYEPFLTAAKAAGAKTFAKPFDSIAPDFLVTAYFTTTAWATEHHDAALRFAQVMNKTSPYINAHYYEMIPLISSFSKIPPETLRTMARVPIPPSLSKATIQPVIDAAAKYHEIPNSFPAKEMFVPGAP